MKNLMNFDMSGAIKAAKGKTAEAACGKVWDSKIAPKMPSLWKTCAKNKFMSMCKAKACSYMKCRRLGWSIPGMSLLSDCKADKSKESIMKNLMNFDMSGAIKAAKGKTAEAACGK